MELFVFSFLGLGAAFGAMALGVLAGRGPLRRGCGSAAAEACAACTRPCPRRATDRSRGEAGP